MWQFVEAVQGVSVAGATVPTSKITKTGGAQLVADAGVSSVETIAGDGFVEFVAIETTTFRSAGLSDADSDRTLADILFAWYLRQDGIAEVREGGNVVATPGAYAANDVFRVERVGSTVRYYQNGELKYTSLVVSAGALGIDTSLLNITGTASTVDSIRFFDAARLKWIAITWTRATNVTIVAGATHVLRRLTFAAPTRMRAGDQLVVALGSQGPEYAVPADSWPDRASALSATLRRGYQLLRRVATDGEPALYVFDLHVWQSTIGALLVYRGPGVAPASPFGASAVDHAATVRGFIPTIAKQRVSDLVVGAVYMFNPQGQTVTTVVGAAKRIELEATVRSTAARLTIVDAIDASLGNVRPYVAVSGLPGGTSFGSAGFALPGWPVQGSRLALSSIAPGAIGLPAEGI